MTLWDYVYKEPGYALLGLIIVLLSAETCIKYLSGYKDD